MKRASLVLFLLLAALAIAGPAPAEDPSSNLSNILSGTFQGSTPGNDLRLTMRSLTTDPAHQFDLFVQVSGTYQEANVRQQGVLRLENHGSTVSLSYIPHFDPAVSALSPQAGRFTQREADAACGVSMKPRGDGFVGETLGSSCAIALRGAISKWTIEVEPGSIRLRDAKSGETLRFRRLAKE